MYLLTVLPQATHFRIPLSWGMPCLRPRSYLHLKSKGAVRLAWVRASAWSVSSCQEVPKIQHKLQRWKLLTFFSWHWGLAHVSLTHSKGLKTTGLLVKHFVLMVILEWFLAHCRKLLNKCYCLVQGYYRKDQSCYNKIRLSDSGPGQVNSCSKSMDKHYQSLGWHHHVALSHTML